MAWMIVRIELKEATFKDKSGLKGPDPEDVIEQLTKRHANCEPGLSAYEDLLNKHGYELGPVFGTLKGDWPYTAYCYVSPNKDGYGRGASTLHRWPVRRAT